MGFGIQSGKFYVVKKNHPPKEILYIERASQDEITYRIISRKTGKISEEMLEEDPARFLQNHEEAPKLLLIKTIATTKENIQNLRLTSRLLRKILEQEQS